MLNSWIMMTTFIIMVEMNEKLIIIWNEKLSSLHANTHVPYIQACEANIQIESVYFWFICKHLSSSFAELIDENFLLLCKNWNKFDEKWAKKSFKC